MNIYYYTSYRQQALSITKFHSSEMLGEKSPGRLNPLAPESFKERGVEILLTHDALEGGS
jgi:hypothetical protein